MLDSRERERERDREKDKENREGDREIYGRTDAFVRTRGRRVSDA